MRPIHRFGASPEGVQQFLWLRSREGRLVADYRILALEYGCSRDRFLDYLEELVGRDDLTAERPVANGRLELFKVRRPGLMAQDDDDLEPRADAGTTSDEETPVPVEDSDEFDFQEHEHPLRRGKTIELVPHYHAWGSMEHTHLLRALCSREECAGVDPHNIHPGQEQE